MRSQRIVILLHEDDDFYARTRYLLRPIVDVWTAQGHAVEMVRGADRFVPADVVIPHLDLTVTPERYRAWLDRYPLVVNRHLTDISKSRISAQLVGQRDSWRGPVIVKTDRNYGGKPEARLGGPTSLAARPARSLWRRAISRLGLGSQAPSPWGLVETLEVGDYPVFDTLQAVPPDVFRNPSLIVEKFLPEMEGEDYVLRYCYIFGDAAANIVMRSRERVVKAANAHSCVQVEPPPQLRALWRARGIDYGKIDYVMRDGEIVLFDVNKTPGSGALVDRALDDAFAQRLAAGLEAFIRGGVAASAQSGRAH